MILYYRIFINLILSSHVEAMPFIAIMKPTKCITIREETWSKLRELGHLGQIYDDVICQLIEESRK